MSSTYDQSDGHGLWTPCNSPPGIGPSGAPHELSSTAPTTHNGVLAKEFVKSVCMNGGPVLNGQSIAHKSMYYLSSEDGSYVSKRW